MSRPLRPLLFSLAVALGVPHALLAQQSQQQARSPMPARPVVQRLVPPRES